MNIPIYNHEGKEAGTVELSERIFGVELKRDVVHQVAVLQQARRRQISAHAKTRGEVSGGGRKPWPQKHTGRARHGSTRSPLWIGGGVSHGPRKEGWRQVRMNKKMRRNALSMVLSEKAKRDLLVLVEDLKVEDSKTKALERLLRKLPCDQRKSLIVLPDRDQEIIRAGNNLPYCATLQAKDLNVLDLLNFAYVVMPKKSLEIIEKTFAT